MPATALAHFQQDINRALAIINHAGTLPTSTPGEQLLRSDLLRSGWMFAVLTRTRQREEMSVTRFWSLFEQFSEFMELNQARLYSTTDLYEAINGLFPIATLTNRLTQPADIVYAAAARVLRFLDRYCVQPLTSYEGQDTAATFSEALQPRGPVYNNGSVWLAWQDLVARVDHWLMESWPPEGSLIATHPPDSCISQESSLLSITYNSGVTITFRVCRACDSRWPDGFLDPGVLQRMRVRRAMGAPAMVYEDSGHQPPVAMKRALERTAMAGAALVIRMNTERNAHVAETCKLEAGANPAQIRFRISDGHMTYHGYFTTTALDAAEQKAAMLYLAGIFHDQCQRESSY